MKRVGMIGLGLCLLAPAGCAQLEAAKFTRQVKNKPARNFELTDLDGATVRLSEFRGKPVLLAFWAFG